MSKVALALVIYQLKHFLADFPLQGRYMLGKFKTGTAWILPLAAHCLVHAAMTALILIAYHRPDLLWLSGLDFGVHFAVDRVKASPNLLGRFKPTQPYFWWALGADQMAHHLTHYFIIWRLLA